MSLKYKMFVSDLDGTLLDDNQQISKENIRAIKKLEQQGIKFVIATGRTKFFLEDFLEKVDYNMPFIWSNGSAISGPQGEILDTEEVLVEVARKVITLAYKYNVEYMIHTLEGIVCETIDERFKSLKDYNDHAKKEYRIPLKIDKDLYDHLESYTILKVSLSTDNSKALVTLQEVIRENIKEVNAVFSEATLLDITAPNASKGAAVLKIAAKYNIEPHEIVTIGDNENDVSMLKMCGLPLTLENAGDSIKSLAKHITKDNNSSGVADGIERFVL